MTKFGSSAICDNCGRSVYRNANSHTNSDNSDLGFSDILGILGIVGLASYAVKKLDSSDNSSSYQRHIDSSSCQPHIDKRTDGFTIRFKRLAWNTLYISFAILFILAGFYLFYCCLVIPSCEAVPFYLTILSGLMLIWGGFLIYAIKGRDEYTVKNIIGSVVANITFKVAGMFAIFANIDFLANFGIAIRAIVGVCFFVAGHYIYKEIRDS